MRKRLLTTLAGACAAAFAAPLAHAADKPTVAPPPAWVLPAPVPPAPPSATGASTVTLLDDSQHRFTRAGESHYFESAYTIAAPQGLEDASLEISWDPALEAVTIHRYRIVRDGKPIDLLGDGSKLTIVRREKNLERAELDGRLTATMQPEDVRVGDTIDYAFTRTRLDPTLGGHTQTVLGPNDGSTSGRLRLRVLWPADKPILWKAAPGVIQPTPGTAGTDHVLTSDSANITAPLPPKGAPSRFRGINLVDVSDFASWAEVSALMGPIYARAATPGPGSPLHAEVARIAAASPDPAVRAAAALALVEDRVRYLALSMGTGGYVPAAADLTWARRFGDCKGKTVLLIALLHELGIEARPVLVSTDTGDSIAERLPGLGTFDHVIVEARVAGRAYFMDGTRLGDGPLERLTTPDYRWGLPLATPGAPLLAIVATPLTTPGEVTSLTLDARTGGLALPARASGEIRYEGEAAISARLKYAALAPNDRDRTLRDLWRKRFDFVTPAEVRIADDPKTGSYRLSMTGTAKLDWQTGDNHYYELDGARLGFRWDTAREDGPNRQAPYSLDFPDWSESRETILLPNGGKGFTLQGETLDRIVQGTYALHRAIALEGGTVTMTASTHVLANEIPFARAEPIRTAMAELYGKGQYVNAPSGYVPTAAELAALKAAKPVDAQAYVDRAAALFDSGDQAGALADTDAALALNPDLAGAHALRALALANKHDPRAEAAAALALALDPKRWLAWRARAILATDAKRWADVEADATHEIELNDQHSRALVLRAVARTSLCNYDGALADVDAALALEPALMEGYAMRAALNGEKGRLPQALADADRAVAGKPHDVTVLMLRAGIRQKAGQRDAARVDIEAVLALKPTARMYLARAELWPPADTARRAADLEAALKLAPGDPAALTMRAAGKSAAGRYDAADADLLLALKSHPDNHGLLRARATLLAKAGKAEAGLTLLDRVIAAAPKDAIALNDRCWLKATQNLHADTALADCDAALALRPGAAGFLDSRGFANFRAGHLEAALDDYDAALKITPTLGPSLYGRALVEARQGRAERAASDFAAARKAAPQVDAEFARYGVVAPPPVPPAVASAATATTAPATTASVQH